MVCCYTALFSQVTTFPKSSDETFEAPDIPPQFPGGYEALQTFLIKNINYPASARLAGIEGVVFISFVMDSSGFIEPKSVKTLQSLHSACDQEAERVLKACNTKWIPATKNGKPIRARAVIPINFRLQETIIHNLSTPIKALVEKKPTNTRKPTWGIYSDLNMSTLISEVNPNDTVDVIGWAPRLFIVNSKNVTGYIAIKALAVTSELEKLISIIEEESPKLEAQIRKQDSTRAEQKKQVWEFVLTMSKPPTEEESVTRNRTDSIELSKNESIFLRLSTSNKNIYVGECTIVNFSFYLSEKNKLKLQFFELNEQLSTILNNNLNKDFCWMASNNIENIVALRDTIGQIQYDVYPIYSASYCPIIAKPITFEPITLQLIQIVEDKKETTEKITTVITKPLTIAVKSLPQNISATSSDYHKLVGQFMVDDSVSSKRVAVGEPVRYSITIKGSGLTYPIAPPKIMQENVSSKLIELSDLDTIINNVYYSSKTFTYSLKFKAEGEYDLSNPKIFSAYNHEINSISHYKTTAKVSVTKTLINSSQQEDNALFVKDNIIALDVSNSMLLQDYKPNRLKAVTEGLNGFLVGRKKCDIGIVLFGGNAIQLNPQHNDACYSSDMIHSIDFGKVKPHTSLGNAIWESINSTSKSNFPKKMVIIGDGENTIGFLTPKTCIELAKKYNIKIYTIGIGKTGTFQVSNHANGKPMMIETVFSNKVYNEIALSTGGQYYWAKDSTSITKILKGIFSVP